MKLQGTLKHGIFILTAVFVLSLFMAGIVHSKDEVNLTPEFLASGKWALPTVVHYDEKCSGKAEFTKNGRFTMFKHCSDGDTSNNIDVKGTYKIKGNKLAYVIEKSQANTAVEQGVKGEATLTDKDSLEYRWYIDFGNGPIGQVYNLNTLIKEGEAVSIKGIDAISTGINKKGMVTSVLKIYEKPDSSAKEIIFSICKDNVINDSRSIDKGKELTIYGRTKDKVKNGKWNNYWYYVSFNVDTCEDFVPVTVVCSASS
jgi:hypothetical protein